jgi:ubiquinone biosynthesis protein
MTAHHPYLAAAALGPHAGAHGALRGIERDPLTPAPCGGWCGWRGSGAIVPKQPDYAAAFQAIGPAAIKLGQTLATRPDLVGEEAAAQLLRLQDSAAAGSLRHDPRRDRGEFRRPLEQIFRQHR